jgi:hypothetical protein
MYNILMLEFPTVSREKLPNSDNKSNRYRSALAKIAMTKKDKTLHDSKVERQFQDPLFHELLIPSDALTQPANADIKLVLLRTIRTQLENLNIIEERALFRGLCHPAGNITAQLICMYGTDRFVDYGPGNLPKSVEGLTPHRNNGEKTSLSADTYAVPHLEWAIAFTSLLDNEGIQNFYSGRFDSFIAVYDNEQLESERTPGNNGGEQWRSSFKNDPTDAFTALIHLKPN